MAHAGISFGSFILRVRWNGRGSRDARHETRAARDGHPVELVIVASSKLYDARVRCMVSAG